MKFSVSGFGIARVMDISLHVFYYLLHMSTLLLQQNFLFHRFYFPLDSGRGEVMVTRLINVNLLLDS